MIPGEKTRQIWRDVEAATSGSSGCSGADARQTDKRNGLCNSPDCQKLGKCNAFEAEVECPVFSPSSAVSDRSGDGQAWLAEFETFLLEQHERHHFLWRNSGAGFHRSQADNTLEIIEKFRELKKQGQSQ